eukprot:TRINITY_DN2590_c0_g1_i2.p1 TRINITY_DN2590_c0_g1~~TRINITY_DN2590_c0_g1_i2.p1  ORF type:complete len:147 (-),score=26.20 TRINITY_DN2590_c0_g1_i2:66-506(-)
MCIRDSRVIKDFMIQGGDPNGDGTGNPGYAFPDEINDTIRFNKKGLLAMANSGPGTNGSQFFVTLKETQWLDGRHTIFGEIVKGQEVVDSIGVVETSKPGDKPNEPVIICLLYTSDAADDLLCVDLGGRRIIKKKKTIYYTIVNNK